MGRPVVAIVGRTNVGKSTLFNRILGRRQAVVDDLPGVTRDSNTALADWAGIEFHLVDTGGLVPGARGGLQGGVRRQVEGALEVADLVLLVVDVEAGLIPLDQQIGRLVRKSGRPSLVVANKVDSPRREPEVIEFTRLGLGESVPVSALHGHDVGDLLDRVVSLLPANGERPTPDPESVRVAIVGRPNVGKSSLVNKLLGSERMIVDAHPGTTRDAVDTVFEWQGRRFTLVDTAGLRRRTHIDTRTEHYCAMRALQSVERCDVAVQVLDASVPPSRQDYRISSVVQASRRPAVLIFNKWDLVEKETMTARRYEVEYRRHAADLWYAPALFGSALSGQRLQRLPALVLAGFQQARRQFSKAAVNAALEEATTEVAPPGRLSIRGGMQVGVEPIRIAIELGGRPEVPAHYQRYLTNRLRRLLKIERAPLDIVFRARARRGRRS